MLCFFLIKNPSPSYTIRTPDPHAFTQMVDCNAPTETMPRSRRRPCPDHDEDRATGLGEVRQYNKTSGTKTDLPPDFRQCLILFTFSHQKSMKSPPGGSDCDQRNGRFCSTRTHQHGGPGTAEHIHGLIMFYQNYMHLF